MIATFVYIIRTNQKQSFIIYINVQFYLYSSQDLTIKSDSDNHIMAGNIYCINFNKDESVLVYPNNSSGVMLINNQILESKNHANIIYHQIDDGNTLCELKPFVISETVMNYTIDEAVVKLIVGGSQIYIYYNSIYYGTINLVINDYKFLKLGKDNDCGMIMLNGSTYIILFNKTQIIYCDECIDIETKVGYVQIYNHNPNIFNVGQLIKYNFDSRQIDIKCVKDKDVEYSESNNQFGTIYFVEAIKCGRFNYAYSKLSYELKSTINIDTLKRYFETFNSYTYLDKIKAYVTFKNGKIKHIHRFEIKNNLIDNIY